MYYKKLFYLSLFLFFINCSSDTLTKNKNNLIFDHTFTNKGFTLVYHENLFIDKTISKKLDKRSLTIFHKNLKKNTTIKITNIINNKTILAKVISNASYPSFYNSVISPRLAAELDIDLKEPYIEILSISKNSMYVAKRAKIYDEEKKVANKAPVDGINIKNLKKKKNTKKNIIRNFSYKIKIADFYFDKTALLMVQRIKDETEVINPQIQKISNNKYRVYLGPFNNINSLQNSFNDIKILEFENIEIIKND